MSWEGEQRRLTVTAGADLSGSQYLAVEIAGTIAGTTGRAAGILQNKPQSGEAATLAYDGRMKGKAALALALGTAVGVNSDGWLTSVASGTPFIGRTLAAANSGDNVPFVGHFNTGYAVQSGG